MARELPIDIKTEVMTAMMIAVMVAVMTAAMTALTLVWMTVKKCAEMIGVMTAELTDEMISVMSALRISLAVLELTLQITTGVQQHTVMIVVHHVVMTIRGRPTPMIVMIAGLDTWMIVGMTDLDTMIGRMTGLINQRNGLLVLRIEGMTDERTDAMIALKAAEMSVLVTGETTELQVVKSLIIEMIVVQCVQRTDVTKIVLVMATLLQETTAVTVGRALAKMLERAVQLQLIGRTCGRPHVVGSRLGQALDRPCETILVVQADDTRVQDQIDVSRNSRQRV
jgi:hypothetical protein